MKKVTKDDAEDSLRKVIEELMDNGGHGIEREFFDTDGALKYIKEQKEADPQFNPVEFLKDLFSFYDPINKFLSNELSPD
jgi:hypothetical protein